MLFASLYDFAADGSAKSEQFPVSVTKLAQHVRAHHPVIGAIHFWPVPMDERVMLGYVTEDFDRGSAHDDEFKILDIKYAETLEMDWRRIVCCKELMHAFDTPAEKTSTRERFFQLMEQLESPPMHEDFSKMLISEYRAEWMAMITLCPRPLREEMQAKVGEDKEQEKAAAAIVGLPHLVMRSVLSEYYDEAFEELLR